MKIPLYSSNSWHSLLATTPAPPASRRGCQIKYRTSYQIWIADKQWMSFVLSTYRILQEMSLWLSFPPLSSTTHAQNMIAPPLAPFSLEASNLQQSWIPYFFQSPHLQLWSQAPRCSGQPLTFEGQGKSARGCPARACLPSPASRCSSRSLVPLGPRPKVCLHRNPHSPSNARPLVGLGTWNMT